MNLYDAYVILLDATVEKDDDSEIRKARKRIAKKVEAMRLKKERAAGRAVGNDIPVFIPAWIEPHPPSN